MAFFHAGINPPNIGRELSPALTKRFNLVLVAPHGAGESTRLPLAQKLAATLSESVVDASIQSFSAGLITAEFSHNQEPQRPFQNRDVAEPMHGAAMRLTRRIRAN